MADSDDSQTAWADQWIAQQRALLEGLATGTAATDSADASAAKSPGFWDKQWADKHWSELGTAWLGGLVQSMRGTGAAGAPGEFPAAGEAYEAWRTAWSNSLAQAAAPGGWSDMLNRTPPLGLFREQTEAWRAVAAAQADCQRLEQELAAVMRGVQVDALTLLEQRVQGRREQGSPVQGFRELYDLWVECSEEIFGTVAHSSAYGHLQGEMGNATIRLKARIQKVIEQGLRQFDLPTRSEINSVHLQLRQLKQKLVALQTTAAADSAASTRSTDQSSRSRTKASATTARKQSTRAPRRSR